MSWMWLLRPWDAPFSPWQHIRRSIAGPLSGAKACRMYPRRMHSMAVHPQTHETSRSKHLLVPVCSYSAMVI